MAVKGVLAKGGPVRPPWWLLVVFLGAVLVAAATVTALLPLLQGFPIFSTVLAGIIYVVSHGLRAIRLAFLSIDLFGVSGRTAVAMHLSIAPTSLLLPFKLGELLRLYELWRLSRTFAYSVVGLLIDRMYDSLFLIPLLVFLLARDSASPMFASLTLLAAVVPLMVMVIGPRLLTDVQRYLVSNHNNRRVLDALRLVNATRVLVRRAAAVAWKRAPELCVISLLIWLCELLFCLVLVTALSGQATAAEAFDLLGARLATFWWSGASDPVLQSALTIATISLLLLWPLALTAYLPRRNHEPRRASAALRINIEGNNI